MLKMQQVLVLHHRFQGRERKNDRKKERKIKRQEGERKKATLGPKHNKKNYFNVRVVWSRPVCVYLTNDIKLFEIVLNLREREN